jgi:hypothetical protein
MILLNFVYLRDFVPSWQMYTADIFDLEFSHSLLRGDFILSPPQ